MRKCIPLWCIYIIYTCTEPPPGVVVQEIPHLGIKVQRAVPVLTMKEVKNVMVNWLTYSGVQSCFCVWDKKDVDHVRFNLLQEQLSASIQFCNGMVLLKLQVLVSYRSYHFPWLS